MKDIGPKQTHREQGVLGNTDEHEVKPRAEPEQMSVVVDDRTRVLGKDTLGETAPGNENRVIGNNASDKYEAESSAGSYNSLKLKATKGYDTIKTTLKPWSALDGKTTQIIDTGLNDDFQKISKSLKTDNMTVQFSEHLPDKDSFHYQTDLPDTNTHIPTDDILAKSSYNSILSCNVTPVLMTSHHAVAFQTSIVSFPKDAFTQLQSVQVQTTPYLGSDKTLLPTSTITTTSTTDPTNTAVDGTDIKTPKALPGCLACQKSTGCYNIFVNDFTSPCVDTSCREENKTFHQCNIALPCGDSFSKPFLHQRNKGDSKKKKGNSCTKCSGLSYPCAIPQTTDIHSQEVRRCEMEINCTSNTDRQTFEFEIGSDRKPCCVDRVEGRDRERKTQFISAYSLQEKRLGNTVQTCNGETKKKEGLKRKGIEYIKKSESTCQRSTSLYLCDNRLLHPSKAGCCNANAILSTKHQTGIMPVDRHICGDSCHTKTEAGSGKDKNTLLVSMLRQCIQLLEEQNKKTFTNNGRREVDSYKCNRDNHDKTNISSLKSTGCVGNTMVCGKDVSTRMVDKNACVANMTQCKGESRLTAMRACGCGPELNTGSNSASSIVLVSETITLNKNCRITQSISNVKNTQHSHFRTAPQKIRNLKDNTGVLESKCNDASGMRSARDSIAGLPRSIQHIAERNRHVLQARECSQKLAGNPVACVFDRGGGVKRDAVTTTVCPQAIPETSRNCVSVLPPSPPKISECPRTVKDDVTKKPAESKAPDKLKKYKKYKIFFGGNKRGDSSKTAIGSEETGGSREGGKKGGKFRTGASAVVRVRCQATKGKDGDDTKGVEGQTEDISVAGLEERIGERVHSVIERTKELKKDIAKLQKCRKNVKT